MKKVHMLMLTVLFLAGIVSTWAIAADMEIKTYRASIEQGIQRVDIIGGDYYFEPNYIIVKVNVPVEFHVRKQPGIVPHDIVMHEPDADIVFTEKLRSEPKIIRFTPKKTGIFPFYCKKKLLFLKGHREKGMEGVLEVIE